MAAIRTSNNPDMLIWAREEIGYSAEQAAEAIGISVESLINAESGKGSLTLNQLRKAAEKYNSPFGYFYLSKPPYEKSYEEVPDFRVEPGLHGIDHYRLNLEIKKVRDQRLVFIELASSLEMELNSFQVIHDHFAENIGTTIRERLNILDSEVSSLSFEKVYSYWKSKIEADGVLVYESQYIPDVSGVIGAAIFNDICPIILIKRGGSANARKLFTLLHEYAHLLIGKSAINDDSSQTTVFENSEEQRLEASCNQLAAEILIPSEKINLSDYEGIELVEKMENLASEFRVTYTTAAVCLRRLDLISKSELSKLLDLRRKEHERKKSNKSTEARIPRENIMRLDLGRPMFNVVLRAYSNGALDIFDTSKLLSLRVKKIDKLMSGMH